jgi:hypothetical protein
VLALLVSVVVVGVLLERGDDEPGSGGPATVTVGPSATPGGSSSTAAAASSSATAPASTGSTGATSAPSSTAPTTATSVPEPAAPVDRSTAVWPLPGTTVRFTDPVDVARDFAVTYLGFTAPVVGPYAAGDARSGEVPVRPTANGPVTTILVRELGGDDGWSVLGAATPGIEVTAPSAGDEVASPVRVTGRAFVFEGTVQVQVRQDAEGGGILGAGFVTGGGTSLEPFTGAIAFETAGSPYGAVVFLTESAENGQVWEAAVVRVGLVSTDVDALACEGDRPARPRPASGQMEVTAYFTCETADEEPSLRPVHRIVPESPGVLRASLEALLAGPTAEERAASLGSWFSASTAGMLRSVTIRDGHAVVDLGDLRAVISGASSSAGSERLLSQLDATVFQFPTVSSVEYRLEGSCEAFSEWLQYGGCTPRTRDASPD